MSIFALETCSVREATIKVLKLLPESIARPQLAKANPFSYKFLLFFF